MMLFWSAVTCHRFLKHRLVDVWLDKSSINKAVTSHRTPKNLPLLLIFVCLFLSGCSWQPNSSSYREFYSYVPSRCSRHIMEESDYFLVVLVSARHLDYSDNASLLRTMAKHPSDGSKNGDVGHVWIYVEGWQNGERVYIEGGQSGDTGYLRPTYMLGVVERALCGEANPASYLWESLPDGFFQPGSGEHIPSFAAKVDLTKEQFENVVDFILNDDYTHYSLVGKQCCSFASDVAAIADWKIDHRIEVSIDEHVEVCGGKIPLRSCDKYATLVISSPDVVERSLVMSVKNGEAEDALRWYLKHKKKCFPCGLARSYKNLCKIPSRIEQYVFFFNPFNN